jgi:hypothetical protein
VALSRSTESGPPLGAGEGADVGAADGGVDGEAGTVGDGGRDATAAATTATTVMIPRTIAKAGWIWPLLAGVGELIRAFLFFY